MTTFNRREKALFNIDIKGFGLEIGPSFAPFITKKDGHNVHIADHLSSEKLRAKYEERGVPTHKIEDVDYDLSEAGLTAQVPRNSFDYVLASHVIEHVPDLIQFLSDIWTVLKPGGVLSLVVPDKRFCFDRFRPVIGLAPVIDAHMMRRDKPSPGVVAEGLINYVFNLDEKRIWPPNSPKNFKFRYEHEITRRAMLKAAHTYMDCHVWTFTPLNLLLMVMDLTKFEFFSFTQSTSFNTDPVLGEFYLSLKKTNAAADFDRPALSKLAFTETHSETIFPNAFFQDS